MMTLTEDMVLLRNEKETTTTIMSIPKIPLGIGRKIYLPRRDYYFSIEPS